MITHDYQIPTRCKGYASAYDWNGSKRFDSAPIANLNTHIMKFYYKYIVFANSDDKFIGSYESRSEAELIASLMSEDCRVMVSRHWIN